MDMDVNSAGRVSRPTLFLVLLAMLACGAPAGSQGAGPLAEHGARHWRRYLEFARALSTRRYYGLADEVIARLDANPGILGIERAQFNHQVGEHYADLGMDMATRRRDFESFLNCLGRARSRYRSYLDYPAIGKRPEFADERFQARTTICRLALAMADGLARMAEDDTLAEARRRGYRGRAVTLFKAAIADFGAAATDKAAEAGRLKGLRPPAADRRLRQTWEAQYRRAREELFRISIERSTARVRFGRFLKEAGAPETEWMAPLRAAEQHYRQLLLDFSGNPGTVQVNLELARCLIELGPQHDAEVLERLGDVWRKRVGFIHHRRIPCEAAQLRADVLLRQKKPSDAIAALDALLAFASGGTWEADKGCTSLVAGVLTNLPETDRQSVDPRFAARAVLRMAEAFALRGEQADNGMERRRHYGLACDLAVGVLRVRRFVEPRYTPLIDRWLDRSGRPAPPEVLWQRYIAAIDRKDYRAAAGYMRSIASLETAMAGDRVPAHEKRERWYTLGQCYHAAGMGREAACAFLAAARWFPQSFAEAHAAAVAAIAVAHKQYERTGSPLDKRLFEWVQEEAAAHSITGEAAVALRTARRLREQGKPQKALEALARIGAADAERPDALLLTALIHRDAYTLLPPAERDGPAGRRALRAMEEALHALFVHHRAAYPKLVEQGADEGARHLVDVMASALVLQTDALLRPPIEDPRRVLALTDALAREYPGIDGSSRLPLIYYNRLRAACALLSNESDPNALLRLRGLQDSWIVLKRTEGAYRARAAVLAAQTFTAFGRRLDALAAETADPGKKASLVAKARRQYDRGLDFYIELLHAEPGQPARRLRYIVHRLRTREHDPKSADHRQIVAIVPRAIERLADDAETVLDLKTALGVARQCLGQHRDAIPPLEEADDILERSYQAGLQRYRQAQSDWEENGRRSRRPPRPPRRDARHPAVKQALASSYLAVSRRESYERALDAWIVLVRLYDRTPERYREVAPGLCETLRRLGRLEDAARNIDRLLRRPSEFHPRRDRLRDLVARIRADAVKLPDAARRDELLPFIDGLLEQLRR